MNISRHKPAYIKLKYDHGKMINSQCNKYFKYSNPCYARIILNNIGDIKLIKGDSLTYSRKEDNNNMFSFSIFRNKQLQLIISYYKLSNKYYIKKFNEFNDIELDDNNSAALEAFKKMIPLLSDEPDEM